MKNKKLLKVLLVLLALVIAGVIFSCTYKKAGATEDVLVETSETSSAEDGSGSSTDEETSEEICVYVCGCVVNPDVYYLESGSRICDAIESAGGFTDDADRDYLNLAAPAEDGQQIYIPTEEEAAQGLVPASAVSSSAGSGSSDGLVNINTATAEELKTLPGIGDTKAEAIITYRENNGAFTDISEIMNVAGIKESAYEKIKDYIKV